MLNQQKVDMLAISYLSHGYLAQYGQKARETRLKPHEISRQNMRNSENIGHIVLAR